MSTLRRAGLVVLVILSFALTGCSQRKAVQAYLDEVTPLLEQYEDVHDLAGKTPRVALSGPISDMQTIKRECEDIEPPEPAAKMHRHVLRMMDYTIRGLLAFAGEESQDTQKNLFSVSKYESEQMAKEYGKLQEEFDVR